MRRAPWPDFAGNPIHEGDTIRHPHSGESGVVVFLPMYPDPGDAWRVNYGDQYESRLCLQIDNKGMAVVVPATDLPTPKGTPVSIDKQLPAYKSHKTVRALKIASIQQAPVQPTVGGGSWLITPANTTFCPFEVPHAYVQKHRPEEGGYWVQYEDGYQSFSPAKAFEEGYEMLSATVATDRPAMTESKDETHFLQPKITGYRQLNPTEVALMNEGKALAEQCGAFIAKLRKHPNVGGPAPTGDALPALDQRWISIGATDLQTGFMAVTRGIARPTTF